MKLCSNIDKRNWSSEVVRNLNYLRNLATVALVALDIILCNLTILFFYFWIDLLNFTGIIACHLLLIQLNAKMPIFYTSNTKSTHLAKYYFNPQYLFHFRIFVLMFVWDIFILAYHQMWLSWRNGFQNLYIATFISKVLRKWLAPLSHVHTCVRRTGHCSL